MICTVYTCLFVLPVAMSDEKTALIILNTCLIWFFKFARSRYFILNSCMKSSYQLNQQNYFLMIIS